MKPLELKVDDELVLRQYTQNDSKAIFELIDRNREHLSQYGDGTAEKYQTLNDVVTSISNPDNPDRLRFGLWLGDTLIGTRNIQLNNDDTAEVGSYLGKEYQGKGYMSRAMQRMITFAFEELQLKEIYAMVAELNERSIAMVTRAGFVQDPTKTKPATKTQPIQLYFSIENPE